MLDKKELQKKLIGKNIKTIKTSQIVAIAEAGLNCCDVCGVMDLSEELCWIDGEDFPTNKKIQKLINKGVCALCDGCYIKVK